MISARIVNDFLIRQYSEDILILLSLFNDRLFAYIPRYESAGVASTALPCGVQYVILHMEVFDIHIMTCQRRDLLHAHYIPQVDVLITGSSDPSLWFDDGETTHEASVGLDFTDTSSVF